EVEREREKVTTWRTSLLPHADIGTSQIFVAILERSKKAFLNSNSLGFPSRSLLPSQLFYVDHSHGPVLAPATLSCFPVYSRDSRSRRLLCLALRSVGEGMSSVPFARFFLLPFGFLILT